MICSYCGAQMKENNRFCLNCGTGQVQSEKVPPIAKNPVKEESVENYRLLVAPAPMAPVPKVKLPTGRGLTKMVLLGILTLGIYPIVIWSRMAAELNIVASRFDGKRTASYFGMVLLAPLTLGIYPFVWMHKFCGRIGRELQRRELDYRFGPKDFWLWNILGCLILVGPFVFTFRLMKAMNKINAHFNING